jgi:hypothetical protein
VKNGLCFVPLSAESEGAEGGTVLKYDGRPSTSSAYACRICFCRDVNDLLKKAVSIWDWSGHWKPRSLTLELRSSS